MPSARILRAFLQENGASIAQAGAFSSDLENEHYFVFRLSCSENAFLIAFLEHFLPFSDSLARAVLQNSQKLFWELEPERLLASASEKTEQKTEYLDLVASRMVSLRREEGLCLRLAGMKNRVAKKPAICSVSGFFRHLKELLQGVKLGFSLCMSEEVDVYVSTETLSFAVLNLIQFAFLYEGETKPDILVKKGMDQNEIEFSFLDRGGLFEDCFLILSGQNSSSRSIYLSPLLCVAALCGEEGIEMKLAKSEGKVSLILCLPKADHFPDSFLSDPLSGEALALKKMVQEWFI